MFIEELEDTTVDPALTTNYRLKNHIYLSASQHILISAETETIIIDYKGNITDVIPVVVGAVSNWNDGFLLAEADTNLIHFYRFEEQKYIKKATFELPDKDSRIVNMDTYDEKVIVLLSNAVMLIGKSKYDTSKHLLKMQL